MLVFSAFSIGLIVGSFLSRPNGLEEDGIDSSKLPFEGKSWKKSHHKHHDESLAYCQDGQYSKSTLKLAFEVPFHALFPMDKEATKFEASAVIVDDGAAYAICDSSWDVYKFDPESLLTPGSLIKGIESRVKGEESGYEALFKDGDNLYVVRESILSREEEYHAVIERLETNETKYGIIEACPTAFTFEGNSKGFEGAVSVHDQNGTMVMLGLCEGNHCSESRKNDVGNGKLVAMQIPPGSCVWETLRVIDLPSSAAFRDYSDIALNKATGRVAITSQEESQVWIGHLSGLDETTGLWDINEMDFGDKGKIYDFPKNDQCETVYCNIEGIYWLNDFMLLAVSDKMKGKGRQDFRCFAKDQSIHAFVLS